MPAEIAAALLSLNDQDSAQAVAVNGGLGTFAAGCVLVRLINLLDCHSSSGSTDEHAKPRKISLDLAGSKITHEGLEGCVNSAREAQGLHSLTCLDLSANQIGAAESKHIAALASYSK